MKNLLKLHEAVAVILLNEPLRTADFSTIAKKIDKRGLFSERKGGISLEHQIRLRTSISSSRYQHWFNFRKPDILELK